MEPRFNVVVVSVVVLSFAATAEEEYTFFSVAESAVPVWVRPFFFWKAFTAVTVPLPYSPSQVLV